ncbi:MAG TPA: ATP-binding protein [Aestuariivirgaceae bacterium]|nr:ATP-binding protein [Aestuariivirgaceae bacterium]
METYKSLNAGAARSMQKNVRIALLILSTVGVLVVIAGMELFSVTDRSISYQTSLENSTDQKTNIRHIFSAIQNAETSQRGFLLTSDPGYLRRFETTREEVHASLARLLDDLGESPEQLSRARKLNDLSGIRMQQLAGVLAENQLSEHAPDGPLGAIIGRGRADAEIRTGIRIQDLVDAMIAFEEQEIRIASRALGERIRFSRTLTILLLVSIALLVTFVVTLGLAYLADSGRIEAELLQAMVAARHASEAKTEFLASMSHEIRTPLTGILGYTELLQEEDLTAQQHNFVEHLQIAGLGLSALVDDILEFSTIEAGEIVLVEEPLSLRTLIANVLSIVSLSAQKKDLELRSEIDPALPETVLGEEPRLRQVLLNLLTNAIKFTREGAVTVRVKLQDGAERGEMIHFEVSDTGIGIAADRQGRLFQRFSQADPSIQHEYGGTGLGLAISKKHVELMGGTIGLDSEEGRGSTLWFRVALPRCETPMAQLSVEGTVGTVAEARILLVEDSAQNRDLVLAILTRQGHHVDVANNGEDAVTATRSHAYDLILMDIQMPRMDGVTATRTIRAMGGPATGVPIIAMTANVLRDQLRSFRKAGFDDHITKPFSKAQLIAKVARWLSSTARRGPRSPSAQGVSMPDGGKELDTLRELMGEPWVRASLVRLKERIDEAIAEATSQAPNREQLKRQAHSLVSDAGQLGFSELSGACSTLEEACSGAAAIGPALGRARRAAGQARNKVDHLLSGTGER